MYYSSFAHYLPKIRNRYSKAAQHLTRMLDTLISQFVWNIWYLLYSENVIGLIFKILLIIRHQKYSYSENAQKSTNTLVFRFFIILVLKKITITTIIFLMFNFSRHYFKLELKAKVTQSLLKNCSIKEHYTDVVIF